MKGKYKMNKKAQLIMVGIMMAVLGIFAFAMLLPLINQAVSVGIANTNSTTLQALFRLYPIWIALGLMTAIGTYFTLYSTQQ